MPRRAAYPSRKRYSRVARSTYRRQFVSRPPAPTSCRFTDAVTANAYMHAQAVTQLGRLVTKPQVPRILSSQIAVASSSGTTEPTRSPPPPQPIKSSPETPSLTLTLPELAPSQSVMINGQLYTALTQC